LVFFITLSLSNNREEVISFSDCKALCVSFSFSTLSKLVWLAGFELLVKYLHHSLFQLIALMLILCQWIPPFFKFFNILTNLTFFDLGLMKIIVKYMIVVNPYISLKKY